MSEKLCVTLHKALAWLPVAAFALFALLNFVFLSCPVASIFGLETDNVYQSANGFVWTEHCQALIALCAITCVVAMIYTVIANSINKKARLAGVIMSYTMYAGILAAATALAIAVGNDGIERGLACNLIIAFCIVFACIGAAALTCDTLLKKNNTIYCSAVENNPNVYGKFATTLGEKAKIFGGKVKVFAGEHKKQIIIDSTVLVSLAIILVVVFVVILPWVRSIFRINKVKYLYGDSKESIEKHLGEPYGDKESNTWEYFDASYLNLLKKQEELNKKAESITDFGQLKQLAKEQMQLDEQKQTLVYKYIRIQFSDNGYATSVVLDTQRNSTAEKELSKVELKAEAISYDDWYDSYSTSVDVISVQDLVSNESSYSAEYKDGSYKECRLPSNIKFSNEKFENNDETVSYFASSVTITWQDDWGEYIVQADKLSDYITYDTKLKETEWLKSQPDGPVYLLGCYVGYHGELAPNSEITIDDGTISIAPYAFEDELNITEINLPTSVKIVGIDAFSDCYNLKAVNYDGTLTDWCNIRFGNGSLSKYCKELNIGGNLIEGNLMLPEGITAIRDFAFYGYDKITSITFPDSLIAIGPGAFANCINLTETNTPKNLQAVGADAFTNCGLIKMGTWDETNSFTYEVATLGTGDDTIDILNKVHYNPNINGQITGTTITIPDSIYIVASHVVDYTNLDYRLEKIKIDMEIGKVQYLSPYLLVANDDESERFDKFFGSLTVNASHMSRAFIGSGFESIKIGNNVTCIDQMAFAHCNNLTWITIPDNVTKIDKESFFNCIKLATIEIPSSVTSINRSAFFATGPIVDDERTTTIKYDGTKAQWKALQTGQEDFKYLCDLNNTKGYYPTIECTDGTITDENW